ncbi:barstar family protein [Dyella silvatica]|uniref:barstar family protein n=1 Tax=Dyella silvatica TaxID=2992128 RepID=UPI0022539A9F|nr:barstar family protein [Dyella silvatica]
MEALVGYSEGVHWLNDGPDAEAAISCLACNGWTIFRLTSGIRSVPDFFEAIREALPLNPAVLSQNWDALSDSLWSGLDALPTRRILLLWPFADQLKVADCKGFLVASELLTDLCISLGDEKLTTGNPKSVVVFQTGSVGGVAS